MWLKRVEPFRLAAASLGALVSLTGCGGPAEGSEEGGSTASAGFSLQLPPDLGGSILLCGARQQEADHKYTCDNVLPCGCYQFDADGTLVQWDPQVAQTEPARIDDLCPSNDVPYAAWEFTFTIWSDTTCGAGGGVALNGPGGGADYVCYDTDHLLVSGYENKAVEDLYPGENANQILCITDAGNP